MRADPVTRLPIWPHSLNPQVLAPHPLFKRSIDVSPTESVAVEPVTGSIVFHSIELLPRLEVTLTPDTNCVKSFCAP